MIVFRFFSRITIMALTLLVLTGCARSPATQFYMLSSSGGTSETKPYASVSGFRTTGPRVAVFITVPAYLDRPQMVIRRGYNVDVQIEAYHEWSEPMADGVTRVLCEELSASLVSCGGMAFPLRSALPADWRISVDVARLDGVPGGEAVLDALWTLSIAKDSPDNPATSGRFVSRMEAGDDMNSLVAAQSTLLARFAQTLADELKKSDPISFSSFPGMPRALVGKE